VVENAFGILSQKFQIIREPYNHCRRIQILFLRTVFCIIIWESKAYA
jgi:hypothetical protein